MKTYRAILFDLFDTVIDFHLDRLASIEIEGKQYYSTSRRVYEVFRRYYPDVAFEAFYNAFRESRRQLDVERAESLREFPSHVRFRRMMNLLNLDSASDELIEQLVWTHMNEWSKGAEMPEANRHVLERAKKRFRLGIVSNFDHPPTAHRLLEREGIHHLFDVIAISGEIGWRKPHQEIFLHALTRLDMRPVEALFVGDTYEADVIGSKSIGMDVVWLNRKGAAREESLVDPDYVITRLDELEGILEEIR